VPHPFRPSRRRGQVARGALIAVVASLTLAGCSPTVALTSAPNANAVRCASVTIALPDTVAGQASRQTNAQATGAWGNPVTVVLYCGTPVQGPTTKPCVTVNGVDWVKENESVKHAVFTAFGRSPGIEVVVDGRNVSGVTVLDDLADAVSVLPQKAKCLDSTND
jgi:hypothetical protein